jgi:hypothetical protein
LQDHLADSKVKDLAPKVLGQTPDVAVQQLQSRLLKYDYVSEISSTKDPQSLNAFADLYNQLSGYDKKMKGAANQISTEALTLKQMESLCFVNKREAVAARMDCRRGKSSQGKFQNLQVSFSLDGKTQSLLPYSLLRTASGSQRLYYIGDHGQLREADLLEAGGKTYWLDSSGRQWDVTFKKTGQGPVSKTALCDVLTRLGEDHQYKPGHRSSDVAP